MAAIQDSRLEPALIVIFGITGDLSRRYLLPSLNHLIQDNLLHEQTRIIGVTRGNTTTDELFAKVELGSAGASDIAGYTSMFKMDLDDPAGYQALLKNLNGIEAKQGACMNRLYYLSIPPPSYLSVIRLLGENGLNDSCQHGKAGTRLLVEKPFGLDLESAKHLVNETGHHFKEEQVFRIDHYMAKETVQNILTFRFKNPIFENVWNKDHIASIDIVAKEKIGIEGRATFYEPLGALRDFIQSHLLQILGIVTMDKPDQLDSDHIHQMRQAVLESIEAVPDDRVCERVIRGQYEGYRQEVDNPRSVTETYADVTVYLDNPRWQGVPVRMITGKALDERKTEVIVTFQDSSDSGINQLRFRIQPNEGIELDLLTKKPGFDYEAELRAMDLSYKSEFGEAGHPTAYEKVLVDAVRGDHTLFATSDEILASWRVLQPVLDGWSQNSDDLVFYQPGTADPSLLTNKGSQ